MSPKTAIDHFDGVLESDDRSPSGYMEVYGVRAVLINPDTGRLVITGQPNDQHNCDRRGCGSFEHKIAEFEINADELPPIRSLIKENQEVLTVDE